MTIAPDPSSAVLEFYQKLPFNFSSSPVNQVDEIRRWNAVAIYPVLPPLLKRNARVLEAGCGAGTFSCNLAYHYKAPVLAIDFNPVAIERARDVARLLKVDIEFRVANIFEFRPEVPADLAVSLGVLHHTKDCHAAIRHICSHYIRPGGHFFLGLYHLDGRGPFLEHFSAMKQRGASEAEMFKEYARLDTRITDRTYLQSWFRDQVLHPHETGHTLREMVPLLEDCGMSLRSTSINNFAPIASMEALFAQEMKLSDVGRERLAAGQYYPGFFLMLAQKT
ncbi:MAG: class I SAM-dependent methyltransferase [Pseudolabrys sp.]